MEKRSKGRRSEEGWRKRDAAKSRMLNIEALAAGLMKLTMQVNSLLEETPPPPPPSPALPLPPLSCALIGPYQESSRVCVCVCPSLCVSVHVRTRSQVAMHGEF